MIKKDRLLQTFLEYVRIDSESGQEGAMAARLAADLQAIGCQTETDMSQDKTGSQTGNLFCTLPGTTGAEPWILSAHMDTVCPGRGIVPVITDGVIRSQSDTVLGGDDKSGVAVIVEVLRTLAEQNLPHPTIQAVFTVCEEVGLKGSRFLDYGKLAAKKAVVLDSGGDAGKIITSAPGQCKLEATVTGRTAHAGVAPEDGISAIQVMAHAIASMQLLRIDEETTANIGTISSQYATNIVPAQAQILAEVRSRSAEKLDRQVQHMLTCLRQACDQFGATLHTQVTPAYSAYAYSQTDPFVQEVAAACRRAGLVPSFSASGGGSDANHFNANGRKALVLGTGMSKVHTTQEELTVKNLEDTAAFVLALMTQ